MRYVIALTENKKTISRVFARAPFFAIIEKGSTFTEVLENPFFEQTKGVGGKIVEFMVTVKSVSCFIAYEFGLKLKDAGDEHNVQFIVLSKRYKALNDIDELIKNQ